jgi:hypothetical protein
MIVPAPLLEALVLNSHTSSSLELTPGFVSAGKGGVASLWVLAVKGTCPQCYNGLASANYVYLMQLQLGLS